MLTRKLNFYLKNSQNTACVYLLLCVSGFLLNAQDKKFINPFPIQPSGYTHVVSASGDRMIFISGQVPVNEKNEVIGIGDIEKQTRQVYENLKKCLEASGAGFGDVVKMTTYVKDYKPEYLSLIRKVRKEYLPADQPPASTLVGVQALYDPNVWIEIEAIAVIRDKKK